MYVHNRKYNSNGPCLRGSRQCLSRCYTLKLTGVAEHEPKQAADGVFGVLDARLEQRQQRGKQADVGGQKRARDGSCSGRVRGASEVRSSKVRRR